MKQENKRQPEFYTATDGTALARMPLSQPGKFAILDAADMRALMDAGISTQWCIKHAGYVAVNIPGALQTIVARLITGANTGERVNYQNGDKLDMRPENLKVTRKGSRSVNLAALIELQAESRKAREGAKTAKVLSDTAQRRANLWASSETEGQA